MKRISLILLIQILFLSTGNLVGQIQKKTDGDKMKQIVEEIASDSYKGRATGTDECVKTENYFAEKFKKLGLLPAGDKGTFFHHYTLSNYDIGKAELTIDNREYLQGYNLDFNVKWRSDKGEAEGEIVFAGYGINDSELKRNDFDNIDIKGKIVLIRLGCPGNDLDKWGASAIDSVKAKYCYDNGAKGILFFSPINFNSKKLQIYRGGLATVEKIKEFPVVYIEDHVVKHVFNKTKHRYYRIIYSMDNKNVSFNTGKKVKMKAEVIDKPNMKARNVLAMLPGTDPKLKNEYVIIGGHMDHIGLNSNKEICNGADDNASGVAVTLGIAEAMTKNKFKPKRSVIFACWSGEEMGLLGSEAWCKKPSLDIYKTVVYFNLDMVGLGDGNLNMPGTLYAPEITAFIKSNTDSLSLKKVNWKPGGLGGSDHNSFLKKGIPAFAGMTSGKHPDYHQPGDDAEKIKSDILQFVGDFIYHCTEKITLSEENFISEKKFAENRNRISSTACYVPLNKNNITDQISKNKPKIAFVNISEGINGKPEQNFLSILDENEELIKKSKESSTMNYFTNVYEAVRASWWSDKTSLFSAFNLEAVGYSELYCKVLSKNGFKLGILDENFENYSDSTTRKKFIKCINDENMGIVLNNTDLNKLSFILEKSEKPIMVISNNFSSIDKKGWETLKRKSHFVVYQVGGNEQLAEMLKKFDLLKDKLGVKSIGITFKPGDTKSVDKAKELLSELENNKLSEKDYYLVSEQNFLYYLTNSLQEYPVKVQLR